MNMERKSDWERFKTYFATKTGDRLFNFIYIGIWGVIIIFFVSAKRGYFIGMEVDKNQRIFEDHVIQDRKDKEDLNKNIERLYINDSIIFHQLNENTDSVLDELKIIKVRLDERDKYENIIQNLKKKPNDAQ